jgi:hypothetical protein
MRRQLMADLADVAQCYPETPRLVILVGLVGHL